MRNLVNIVMRKEFRDFEVCTGNRKTKNGDQGTGKPGIGKTAVKLMLL